MMNTSPPSNPLQGNNPPVAPQGIQRNAASQKPARLLKGSPTATDAAADTSQGRVGVDDQAATALEEHLLRKVMSVIYSQLHNPKFMRTVEGWLVKTQNVGQAIGGIAFRLLMSAYSGAKSAGIAVPVSVFMGQGGAVQQTIEALLQIAEHAGIPDVDPDKVREDAVKEVVFEYQRNKGHIGHIGQPQQQGQPQQFPQAVAAANPLSHAVSQGLQSQGLLGGAQ